MSQLPLGIPFLEDYPLENNSPRILALENRHIAPRKLPLKYPILQGSSCQGFDAAMLQSFVFRPQSCISVGGACPLTGITCRISYHSSSALLPAIFPSNNRHCRVSIRIVC